MGRPTLRSIRFLAPRLCGDRMEIQFSKKIPGVLALVSQRNDGPMGTAFLFGHKKNKRNRSSFLRHHDLDPKRLIFANQVHGNRVSTATLRKERLEADGLVTSQKHFPIAIFTADCYPIYLAFPDVKKPVVGLVHAGRKGVLLNIVKNGVLAMRKEGAKVKNIFVAIGPGICSRCYTLTFTNPNHVRDLKHFQRRYKKFIQKQKNGAYRIDLAGIIQYQLIQAGVPGQNIKLSRICTAHDGRRFFSQRRDKTKVGAGMNQLSVIALV